MLNEMNATVFWLVLDPELLNSRIKAIPYYQDYFTTFDEGRGHRLQTIRQPITCLRLHVFFLNPKQIREDF